LKSLLEKYMLPTKTPGMVGRERASELRRRLRQLL